MTPVHSTEEQIVLAHAKGGSVSLGDLKTIHNQIKLSHYYRAGGMFPRITDVKIEAALSSLATKEGVKRDVVIHKSNDTVLCPRGASIFHQLTTMLQTGKIAY